MNSVHGNSANSKANRIGECEFINRSEPQSGAWKHYEANQAEPRQMHAYIALMTRRYDTKPPALV